MSSPAPTYIQIRERLLHLDPSDLGLAPTPAYPDVWGFVVELGYDVGSATLVALADGTTSLHYSTGGGLVGRGDYPPVAEAARALVSEAQKHLYQMTATREFPLPQAGQIRFVLLGYSGNYTTDASGKSLASGDHPLAPLYGLAQETLNQMRLLAEKKRR
jgi:hypothetical protein